MDFGKCRKLANRLTIVFSSAVFAGGLTPAEVVAQPTATHGGAQDRIDFSIPVTASIAARCGFSSLPNGSVQLGNLEAGFSRNIPFVLNCNTPMRVAIVSQNGGLTAPVQATPGYANRLDYAVTLHLVGTGGVSVVDTCDASALSAASLASCSFKGTASATVGLRLPQGSRKEQGSYIRIASAPASGLAASDAYTDVLALTLSPSA